MPDPTRRAFLAAAATTVAAPAVLARPANKRLVLFAGKPSHPPGMHEHNAGVRLFEKCLTGFPGLDLAVVLNGNWSDAVLDGADAVLVYADGGGGHPLAQAERIDRMGKLAAKGCGLVCVHYAVEVPKGEFGERFRELIGGCYEHQWSCNPIWEPKYDTLPDHPITRGVKPFTAKDEWYFNMRFRPNLAGVTPILTAAPPDSTRDGPYVYPKGPYPHIQAAKGRPEHMMWCVERADGGRGVGFTGGHFHANWGNDDFRTVVLNALVWATKLEVPAGGVRSSVSAEELAANLDPKKK
jgi:trehalose utilization protein